MNEVNDGKIILYDSPDGKVKIDVIFKDESVWLTQTKIAELFTVDRSVITKHLQNIYFDGELTKKSTSAIFAQVQNEGSRKVTRNIEYYNLDAIISVGYRVNSLQATKFRVWATQTLREFIIKGFVLDDERLKNGEHFGKDYFDELLERIRQIRASERRFYQKITDLYAIASIDYDPHAEVTKTFFKIVQNKLLFGVTGHTAAEIISSRADSKKEHMGLMTWRNKKTDVSKADVAISKNYLNETEIKKLDRIVNMYLDYAELQAENGTLMKMADWVKKLDAFLQFNEMEILKNAGKVKNAVAEALAQKEYKKYTKKQDKVFVSDFDKETKKYLNRSLKKPKQKNARN